MLLCIDQRWNPLLFRQEKCFRYLDLVEVGLGLQRGSWHCRRISGGCPRISGGWVVGGCSILQSWPPREWGRSGTSGTLALSQAPYSKQNWEDKTYRTIFRENFLLTVFLKNFFWQLFYDFFWQLFSEFSDNFLQLFKQFFTTCSYNFQEFFWQYCFDCLRIFFSFIF